jgi:indolepyruvate ferredoxin oxidoreductase alpha subunit
VESALAFDGVSVIVSREPCPLHIRRFDKKKRPVFTVDQDKCQQHRTCISAYACPAFFIEAEKVDINPQLCIGCAVCAQVCPENAIRPVKN